MTLGGKLKESRISAQLSQEQMAEKLCVSRQAVTKWESDKGLPDIGNLKAIASLLNVSLDYLLDNGEMTNKSVIKEAIHLDDYQKTGRCRCKQDAVVLEKYPKAERIFPLMKDKKLTKVEWVLDLITMPGIFDFAFQMKNRAEYYLVEVGNKQFFVRVGKEFIESQELINKIKDKKFAIGDIIFKRAPYKLLQE